MALDQAALGRVQLGAADQDVIGQRLLAEVVQQSRGVHDRLLTLRKPGRPGEFMCVMSDGGGMPRRTGIAQRKRLEQQLWNLAKQDSLTGLPNRLQFNELLQSMLQSAGDTRKFAVGLIDVDRFKETNDGYGHLVGDRVLGIFASTLRGHFGKGATVARLGGEEFAAILPGADAKTAVEVGEAVRMSFASSAAFVDGMAVGGTVSVGVACNLGSDCDFGALFRQADVALYAAKRAGRNRVELVGPDQTALSEALHATIRTRSQRPEGETSIEHDAA